MNGVKVDGVWKDEPAEVKEEVRRFFSKRFPEADFDRPTLDGIPFNTIDFQQNAMLVKRFQEEEIRRVVWSCGSDKISGQDGLNFKFIKHFWDVIKPDFLRFFDEFHVNGVFSRGLNASFIALIPKVADPQELDEYRPISLIGCTYKILAKVLANRLKKVMHSIINERQTTFIEGRHMLHSVLIANEVVDEAKRGLKSCMIFKVDYEKAYDSV